MPPIPIHKDAPLHPVADKPTGITPQTLDSNNNPPPPTRTTPAHAPATTTSDPTSNSNPPPPQPGARPIPPTNTAIPQPSAFTPAAPQPGPRPGQPPPSGSGSGTVGDGPTATYITTETRLAGGPPPQFNIPPPTNSQLAGRSTTSTTTASHNNKPGPTTLNMGPVASPFQGVDSRTQGAGDQGTNLEHPPGYVQAVQHDNTPFAGGAGDQRNETEQGGVGGAAWNLLAKAGEALQKGEEAAWRAVRK